MSPTTPSADKMKLEAPSMGNAGWATFDTPPKDKQPGVTGSSRVATLGNDKQILDYDLFLFEPSDRPMSFSKDEVSVSNQSSATSLDTSCSQVRNICIALGVIYLPIFPCQRVHVVELTDRISSPDGNHEIE